MRATPAGAVGDQRVEVDFTAQAVGAFRQYREAVAAIGQEAVDGYPVAGGGIHEGHNRVAKSGRCSSRLRFSGLDIGRQIVGPAGAAGHYPPTTNCRPPT